MSMYSHQTGGIIGLENIFWNGVYLLDLLPAERLQNPDQNKLMHFTQTFPSLLNGHPYANTVILLYIRFELCRLARRTNAFREK